MSTVRPVPEPELVVATPVALLYPVPAAEIVPSVLTPDALAFWIQQFKTRGCEGHSEWSETFQRNIWIKDDEKLVSD